MYAEYEYSGKEVVTPHFPPKKSFNNKIYKFCTLLNSYQRPEELDTKYNNGKYFP